MNGKTNITYLLSFVVLMLLSLHGYAQAVLVQALVDRNQLSISETLTVTFEAQQNVQRPDLSPLQQDFEIVNTRQSNSTQVINGHVTQRISWTVILQPLKIGALTIPALNFGHEQSNPVQIQVSDAPAPSKIAAAGEVIFLEAEMLQKTAYVQQQLIYVVRIFHAVELKRGSHLKQPRIQGVKALIDQLGEDRHYTAQRAGQHYRVIERRLVVSPQESGRLTIAPMLLEAVIDDPQAQKRRDPNDPFSDPFFSQWDPFDNNTKTVRHFSPAVTLDIQAPPANFGGQTWLPARSVELKSNWSIRPEALKTGEPVTLTLALIADGLKAVQLPPVSPTQIPDMKQYSNQPRLQDQPSAKGVMGLREEKIVLVPTKAGTFTLPAIEVPWWNTQTQTQQIARIEAQTLTVTGAATAPQAAPAISNPVIPPNKQKSDASSQLESAEPKPSVTTTSDDTGTNPWLYLSIFLLLLLVISLAVIIYLLRYGTNKKPLAANHLKENLSQQLQEALASEKRLRKIAIQACEEDNADLAKQHLLSWGKQISHTPVLSLSQLSAVLEGELAQAIETLNQHLYSPNDQVWSGQVLAQALKRYQAGRKKRTEDTKNTNNDTLAPLHKIN